MPESSGSLAEPTHHYEITHFHICQVLILMLFLAVTISVFTAVIFVPVDNSVL